MKAEPAKARRTPAAAAHRQEPPRKRRPPTPRRRQEGEGGRRRQGDRQGSRRTGQGQGRRRSQGPRRPRPTPRRRPPKAKADAEKKAAQGQGRRRTTRRRRTRPPRTSEGRQGQGRCRRQEGRRRASGRSDKKAEPDKKQRPAADGGERTAADEARSTHDAKQMAVRSGKRRSMRSLAGAEPRRRADFSATIARRLPRMPPMYPTLESTVGNTPLVRLQRMPGATVQRDSRQARGQQSRGLGEGSPGAVDDRRGREARRDQARRHADRGHVAATPASRSRWSRRCKGYRMILVMPDNQSVGAPPDDARVRRGARADARKRAAWSTRAISPSAMRDEGKGVILDQFANPDNPLAHYRGTGPEIWRDTGGEGHAFRLGDGHDRHDHGRVALPQGEESRDPDRRRAARGGLADARDPQVAGGLPAEDLRPRARRPRRAGVAGGRRGDDAPARAEEGIFAGISAGGACAVALRVAAEVENATIVFIVCDRGDRYLSTGVFPA